MSVNKKSLTSRVLDLASRVEKIDAEVAQHEQERAQRLATEVTGVELPTTWQGWESLLSALVASIPASALPLPDRVEVERSPRAKHTHTAWFGGTGYHLPPGSQGGHVQFQIIGLLEAAAADRITVPEAAS